MLRTKEYYNIFINRVSTKNQAMFQDLFLVLKFPYMNVIVNASVVVVHGSKHEMGISIYYIMYKQLKSLIIGAFLVLHI